MDTSDYYDQYKVYVLALEKNKFYVGITKEPERRLAEHKSGKGAKFTRIYKPIGIVYCKNLKTKYRSVAEKKEHSLTCSLMKKYGIDNVRGAEFCLVDTEKVLKSMPSKLRKQIVSDYNSGKYAHSYAVIEQKLGLLLNGEKLETQWVKAEKSKVVPVTHKKKKNKKANFWWETWEKDKER